MILAIEQIDIITLSIIIILAIIISFLIIFFLKRNLNVRRYKKSLKAIIKHKEKNYNANVLIDILYNRYITDQSNTYKTLKNRGKKKIKRYFKFYQDSLNDLVEKKSIITPNMKRNKLVFVFKDDQNQQLGKYYIKDSFNKLKKQLNKHQLLFDMIAYVYELPQYIDQAKPYELENHDNKHIIKYEIVEKLKK